MRSVESKETGVAPGFDSLFKLSEDALELKKEAISLVEQLADALERKRDEKDREELLKLAKKAGQRVRLQFTVGQVVPI